MQSIPLAMKTLLGVLVAQVLIILAGLLLLGWDLLGVPLAFGLPLGNFLAWTGMMTLAAIALMGSPSGRVWQMSAWIVLAMAIAWLPFSLVIFDHPTFSGITSFWWSIWVYYSLAMIVVPLALLLFNGMVRLWWRFSNRRHLIGR